MQQQQSSSHCGSGQLETACMPCSAKFRLASLMHMVPAALCTAPNSLTVAVQRLHAVCCRHCQAGSVQVPKHSRRKSRAQAVTSSLERWGPAAACLPAACCLPKRAACSRPQLPLTVPPAAAAAARQPPDCCRRCCCCLSCWRGLCQPVPAAPCPRLHHAAAAARLCPGSGQGPLVGGDRW